jgi:hypothetical protein
MSDLFTGPVTPLFQIVVAMRFGGKQLIHVLDLLFQVDDSLFCFAQGSFV